jgi:3-deoxy-D-arabino-heptulosonate 7-phosphate (DAHP) synthase class II
MTYTAGDVIVDRRRWTDQEGVDPAILPAAFRPDHSCDPETIHSHSSRGNSAGTALCERMAAVHSILVVRAFVIEVGRVGGRYAKAHSNGPGVTAGSDFPTFRRTGVRYGVNICNEAIRQS